MEPCPNCKSNNTEDVSYEKDNGIMGPEYDCWVAFCAWCCNDCGTLFRPLSKIK